jgi:nitrate reductase NapE component
MALIVETGFEPGRTFRDGGAGRGVDKMIEFVLKIVIAVITFPVMLAAGAIFGAFYFGCIWIEAMTSNG